MGQPQEVKSLACQEYVREWGLVSSHTYFYPMHAWSCPTHIELGVLLLHFTLPLWMNKMREKIPQRRGLSCARCAHWPCGELGRWRIRSPCNICIFMGGGIVYEVPCKAWTCLSQHWDFPWLATPFPLPIKSFAESVEEIKPLTEDQKREQFRKYEERRSCSLYFRGRSCIS